MNTHLIPRSSESFQRSSATAVAVWENAIETESFSDLLDLQQSIATAEFDLNRAVHLIARRARTVANATGTAIALFEENELMYRAGCGSGAAYVGQHLIAALSVSADRSEILCIENAQIDTRIEAAICCQFCSNALVFLPICRDRAAAGVLQILFAEAHHFSRRELGLYRLLAGLVEEALWYTDDQLKTVSAVAIIPPPANLKSVPVHRWMAIAAVLVLTIWNAYTGSRPKPSWKGSVATSNTIEQRKLPTSAKRQSESTISSTRRQPDRTKWRSKADGTKPRWVWVGRDELDYVTPGVTVRYFTPKPTQDKRDSQRAMSPILGKMRQFAISR